MHSLLLMCKYVHSPQFKRVRKEVVREHRNVTLSYDNVVIEQIGNQLLRVPILPHRSSFHQTLTIPRHRSSQRVLYLHLIRTGFFKIPFLIGQWLIKNNNILWWVYLVSMSSGWLLELGTSLKTYRNNNRFNISLFQLQKNTWFIVCCRLLLPF